MAQLVELSVEECLSLLGQHVAGRIGLRTPRGLRIFPVNYAMFGKVIVFRTLAYGEIADNAHEAEMCFELDELDHEHQRGWSVLAVGRSRRVDDHGEVRQIRGEWDPLPWVDGQRNLYFRLDWTELTGRQLGMPARPGLVPVPRTELGSQTV